MARGQDAGGGVPSGGRRRAAGGSSVDLDGLLLAEARLNPSEEDGARRNRPKSSRLSRARAKPPTLDEGPLENVPARL